MFPSQLTPDNSTDKSRETIWRESKEKGKSLFRNGSYAAALESFQTALHTLSTTIGGIGGVPSSEREILLSNMVACRLQIGGKLMASAAVEESKQCILLNDRWAKAYVRLASSYIALGGHSNDACNALQNAIRLDPGHSVARKMLVQQLRRDDRTPHEENEYTNNGVTPNVPPYEEHVQSPSSSSQQQQQQQQTFYSDIVEDDVPLNGTDLHDDDASNSSTGNRWLSSLKERFNRMVSLLRHTYNNLSEEWVPSLRHAYNNLSEEWRSLLQVIIILLVLYVAIGGRFGFDQVLGSSSTQRGDYERGNAYDRFREDSAPQYQSYRPNNDYNDESHHRSTNQYSSYENDNARSSRRSTSYDSHYNGMMPYGFGGGSTSSMAFTMLLVFALNRARAFGGGRDGIGIGMGRWNRFGGLGMLGPLAMGLGGFRGPGMRFQFGGGGGGGGFGRGFGGGRRRWR